MPRLYATPDNVAGEPIACHVFTIRSELWSNVWDHLNKLTYPGQWLAVGDMTVAEVTDHLREAIDGAIFTGCIMIGEVKIWTGATIPDHCLLCDGSTYEREDYPLLYAAIDSAWIVDADHFQVPDFMDRFPFFGLLMGVSGGESSHVLTTAEMPAHTHIEEAFTVAASTALGELPGFEAAPESVPTGSTGGGDAHNNMPPYLTVLPIIVATYPGGAP